MLPGKREQLLNSVIGHIFAGDCLSCAGQAEGNRAL